MKKLFTLIILGTLISITGCNKKTENTIEKKCESMIEHLYELTINSPNINKLDDSEKKEVIETLKGELESKKESSIKECENDFNEKVYNCIINTKKFEELSKCE